MTEKGSDGSTWLMLIGVVVLVLLFARCGAEPSEPPPETVPTGVVVLPRCASESSRVGPCEWDAQRDGNGVGRSFWVDAEGNVHYS